MCIECLLRFGALLRSLCDLRIHPRFARKAHIEGEHVIVPILAVGVLVEIADLEVRLPLGLPDLLCQWIVSVAQLSVEIDSRSRGCGKVGSVVGFPLFHAPCLFPSATLPVPEACIPARSAV